MGTTAEKLQAIINSKEAIRQAIVDKGVSCDTTVPLDEYADKIGDISGGGNANITRYFKTFTTFKKEETASNMGNFDKLTIENPIDIPIKDAYTLNEDGTLTSIPTGTYNGYNTYLNNQIISEFTIKEIDGKKYINISYGLKYKCLGYVKSSPITPKCDKYIFELDANEVLNLIEVTPGYFNLLIGTNPVSTTLGIMNVTSSNVNMTNTISNKILVDFRLFTTTDSNGNIYVCASVNSDSTLS